MRLESVPSFLLLHEMLDGLPSAISPRPEGISCKTVYTGNVPGGPATGEEGLNCKDEKFTVTQKVKKSCQSACSS